MTIRTALNAQEKLMFKNSCGHFADIDVLSHIVHLCFINTSLWIIIPNFYQWLELHKDLYSEMKCKIKLLRNKDGDGICAF